MNTIGIILLIIITMLLGILLYMIMDTRREQITRNVSYPVYIQQEYPRWGYRRHRPRLAGSGYMIRPHI